MRFACCELTVYFSSTSAPIFAFCNRVGWESLVLLDTLGVWCWWGAGIEFASPASRRTSSRYPRQERFPWMFTIFLLTIVVQTTKNMKFLVKTHLVARDYLWLFKNQLAEWTEACKLHVLLLYMVSMELHSLQHHSDAQRDILCFSHQLPCAIAAFQKEETFQ